MVIIFAFSLVIGPCITRRISDAQLRCDDDGNFEPLQCRRMDDGTHTCRCVHPGNGSMVPNTMRTGIREREDAPDCEGRGTYHDHHMYNAWVYQRHAHPSVFIHEAIVNGLL